MLSKRSQSQKFTYSVIPLKRNIRKDTVIESWLAISWGERDGRAGGWQLKEHHVSFWNSQWRWKCSTTDYGKGFKLCESLFMYWNEFHGPWLCVSLVAQPHLTLCYPMDCSLPVSSVCGIVQARILEWVALPFLLQGLFLTQGSNPGLPHCRQTLYHLSYKGSPIFKNRYFKILKIYLYLFLAALGINYSAQAFSSWGEWGLLFSVVHGLFIEVTSLIAEH